MDCCLLPACAIDGEEDLPTGPEPFGAEADGIGGLEQFSIETWIRLDLLAPTEQRFVTLGNEKAILRRFGNELQFVMLLRGLFETVSVIGVLEAGVFYHVAASYDGSRMRLFLNGSLISSRAATGRPRQTDFVHFGGSSTPLGGLIDEIAVYGRALDVSEIRAVL